MDTMGYLFIILALMLDIVCRISGQIYLTTDENPIQGTPFTFVCRTTTLSKTVTFFDSQGRIAGSCLFPEYNCDSGYDYKLSQNISALRTFLTIENLNRSLHQGIWKCMYGQERAQMNLSVMTFPDRVHLEGLQNDVDLSGTPPGIINVTCSCSCTYPDAMIGLSLVVGKSEYPLQSYTYKKQSIYTSYICTDPLENAYTSQFSLNIRSEIPQLTSMTARLKCYVTVSAARVPVFGMSVGRIIFPDSSTTPPRSALLENENGIKKANVGAIVGGVIGGLIFVVLVVVVVCFLIRRRNKKCPTSKTKEKPYELTTAGSAEQNDEQNDEQFPTDFVSVDSRNNRYHSGYIGRRYEKHPKSQTKENPYELTTVGTHSGNPYESAFGNPYQSAHGNNGQSQPDSNSLVLSLGTRNNVYQLAQNMPEGITCTFIKKRVTEDAGRRRTDHNVVEFHK